MEISLAKTATSSKNIFIPGKSKALVQKMSVFFVVSIIPVPSVCNWGILRLIKKLCSHILTEILLFVFGTRFYG